MPFSIYLAIMSNSKKEIEIKLTAEVSCAG